LVVRTELNYFEGQITKYVLRHRFKNGLQDLQKAAHFLEKYKEVYFQLVPKLRSVELERRQEVAKFSNSYDYTPRALSSPERRVLLLLCSRSRCDLSDLRAVQDCIETLIFECEGSAPTGGYTNQDR
jgi:hypothetical protein